MELDDLEPRNQKKELKNLEVLSIEALHEYVDELNEEISRVRIIIDQKEGAKESADTFFKK